MDMEHAGVLQVLHPNNQTDSRASASGPFLFPGVRNLLFHSTSCEWLLVGAPRRQRTIQSRIAFCKCSRFSA